MTVETLHYPKESSKLFGYLDRAKAPVFVKLTTEGAALYPKVAGLWGILIPPDIGNHTRMFGIDFSWRNDGSEIHKLYPGFSKTRFSVKDIGHFSPGRVPPLAYDCAPKGFFIPSKVNQLVAIHPTCLDSRYASGSIEKARYQTLRGMMDCVGVVTKVVDSQVTVTWAKHKSFVVMNEKSAQLIVLPEPYRKFVKINVPEAKETSNVYNAGKNKFEVGHIIRGGTSLKNKDVCGVVGTIKSKKQIKVGHSNQWHYDIDFDNLLTRSLLLCKGEDKKLDLQMNAREYDLDGYNLDTTSLPQLLVYNASNDRDNVWSCRHQCEGVADTKTYPDKNKENEIIFKIQVADKKFMLPDYELDFLYDEEKMREALLQTRWCCIGTEAHAGQEWFYLYLGDNINTSKITWRIKLGRVQKTPSIMAKLAEAMDIIIHPWQLFRYLNKKSLGHFYTVVDAEMWFKLEMPVFEHDILT